MTCKCIGGDIVRGDGGLSVGGSVTLGDGGGMFTLGDVGGTVTLRDAGGIVTCRGGGGIVLTAGRGETLVESVGLAMALSKILVRSTMACCWASTNWENGATGAGLVRASVRARHGCIDGGCFGHWALVWKELHCLGGALRSGLGNI